MKKVDYDLSRIIEMSNQDTEFVKLMVATFIEEIPVDLGHLAMAVVEEDRVNVHRYSHKMKPSLQLFGLEVYKNALVLENWGKNEVIGDITEDFMKLHQQVEDTVLQLKRDF